MQLRKVSLFFTLLVLGVVAPTVPLWSPPPVLPAAAAKVPVVLPALGAVAAKVPGILPAPVLGVYQTHTHTGYPEPLLLACLVQRYVRLGRHAKNAHCMALYISNTPIVGIQKHCCWHTWCRGTCVWGATPKQQICGIVHFKQTHTRYPKTLLLAYLVQTYACLGRQAKNKNCMA